MPEIFFRDAADTSQASNCFPGGAVYSVELRENKSAAWGVTKASENDKSS